MKKTDGRKILKNLPGWESGSWEGAEYNALQKSAGMTFRERLHWLEEASELAEKLQKAGKKPLSI
jgi:hypothetical protein